MNKKVKKEKVKTSEQTLQPKLRFPEFKNADGWVNKPLKELYSFKPTNSYPRELLNYQSGSVKNIHYGDIHTKFSTLFDIRYEEVPFINQSVPLEKIKPENYCIEGDIVFADASEDLNDIGKSIEIVNTNGEKLLCGLHTLLARQNLKHFIVGFGGYLFHSKKIRQQIKKESQGAKVLGISATRLSNIEINFPSDKKEQQKIADCLSSIDELINSQTQKIAALKNHKKGLMQKLFPTEGKTIPEFRFPEFRNAESWEWKKIENICEIIKGKQLNRDTLTSNGSYPVLNGGIEYSGYAEKWNSEKDSITISEGGNSCGFVSFVKERFWLGGHCYKLNNIKAHIVFLYQVIKSKESQIMKLRVGSGLPNIQKKTLANFMIVIPKSPKEQQKIADCLSSIDELINSQTQKIEALKNHKKGLMQQLFPKN